MSHDHPDSPAGAPCGTAAAALPLHQVLLQAISDTSGDVIFAKDRDGRLLFANPATLALIGKPLELVLGRTDAEFLDDELAARRVMENDRRIMECGEPEELEEEVPLPDGTRRVWLSRKAPYRDGAGNVIGLLGISRDVTDRKRTEEALRASEERYRSLFTNMTEGFAIGEVISDERGSPCDFRFVEVNEAFEVQSGLARERARGRPMREVLPAIEQSWIDTYCGIALGDPPRRFESYNRDLDRHFSVYCYSPSRGRFAILFTDVTERIKAEQELREEHRRKDEFLGMLSHELRNPLAPIRNSIHILKRTHPASEQAARAHAVIERQTVHLTRLVDDLLDVTRIARGKIALRPARVDLRELVSRTADDFRPVMHERGVAFEVVLPASGVWADADPTRISQVLGNLLHNAAKFTRERDRVVVSLESADGHAELRVRDTGAGIDPALQPRIFDAFVQGERTLARTDGGLGLGLALVKGVAELHGGSVRVASAGHGRGSEFVVRLPLADAAPAPAPTGSAAAASAGRRVLVVDDNVDAAESLADLLRLRGHAVQVAHDGPRAIAAAETTRPDVVLCDIGLPGMSGYEVARTLRRSMGSAVRLVALSGYAQPDDLARAAQAGFDRHVSKPADPAQLEALLRDER